MAKNHASGLSALGGAELHGLFAVQSTKLAQLSKNLNEVLARHNCSTFEAAYANSGRNENALIEERNKVFATITQTIELMKSICDEQSLEEE